MKVRTKMGFMDIIKIKSKDEFIKKPIMLPCENCSHFFPYDELMDHENECAYIRQPSEFRYIFV